jgi:hypothetical protein
MALIFSGDIDSCALRKGDRFNVMYETLEADGEAVRTGSAVGRVRQRRQVPPGHVVPATPERQVRRTRSGYYTLDGQPRAF